MIGLGVAGLIGAAAHSNSTWSSTRMNYLSHRHRALIVGVASLIVVASPTSFASVANAQPATPPVGVAADASEDFRVFVGTWRAHATQLDVHTDRSASMSFAVPYADTNPVNLTFQFITITVGATNFEATAQVVGSNSPGFFPAGQTWTLVLNASDGVITPTFDGQGWIELCGPNTTNAPNWCGATPPPVVIAPGALQYLDGFVGTWGAHEQSLEVRP